MSERLVGRHAYTVAVLMVVLGACGLTMGLGCKHQAHLSSREQAAVDRVLRDRWTDAQVVYRDPQQRDQLLVVTQQGDEEVSYRITMRDADQDPLIERVPLYRFGPR
ncbi:MAG: hypothetical protein EA401_00515 [Planctomycetota bacterium]|nr:MAG: hypothetical protein EA401_00515 [Planctomycetota bacterium]